MVILVRTNSQMILYEQHLAGGEEELSSETLETGFLSWDTDETTDPLCPEMVWLWKNFTE